MNKEIGAASALSLSATSLRVLTHLGFNVENLRAGDHLRELRASPYAILCRRSELHDEIKRLATTKAGPGSPAIIHLKCDALSCDLEFGALTLKSGEAHHADLIIGAMHSAIRTSVLGYEQIAPAGGRAASRLGGRAEDKTLVNIVAHIPDGRDQDKFSKHLWQLRALPRLPTWIRGCATLIADAAHATFPTPCQGAGMAIEDAVKIGCILPRGTPKDEVPRRLEAYQTLRKERGEWVLTESVEQVMVPAKRGLYGRCPSHYSTRNLTPLTYGDGGLLAPKMQVFIAGHDAVMVAQEYLATRFSGENGEIGKM
ncbi:hypothetical protein FB451DRAFT_1512695 [Mycena latifolia]|nr:hypothetical protein FB451DRAFT_1512695 [Mycena latifolia]